MITFAIKIGNDFSYDSKFIENLNINQDVEIIFEYISDFRSAKVIREFLADLSSKVKIDTIWKSRLILIVDELNNNAIEYGTRSGDFNILRIFLHKNNNIINITIEVEDKGNGIRHKKASEMEALRESRKKISFDNHNSIRGRGLFMIIAKLVDELYFKDSEKGGLIVGVNKKIELNKEA